MSSSNLDGLPENVSLPCRVIVDAIVEGEGFVTVISSKGVEHGRMELEWLIMNGHEPGSCIEFSRDGPKLVIAASEMTEDERLAHEERMRLYFDVHPEHRPKEDGWD